MTLPIGRRQYADLYGPTTGDRVRLADTDLLLEVERDFAVYGDEVTFGGGKVIRDGMGQSARAADPLDLVITNALILDHWGIVKADVGVKAGRIVGIGKAGNPDTQGGVDPALVVGAGTEVIAGEGRLLTAGAVDTHVHFICPQQVDEAIAAGVTTMLGGGTGPATGTSATTCTPGPWHLHRMLKAADALPVNVGFLGKGNCAAPGPLRAQVEAGACGLKLHEDCGAPPRPRSIPAYRLPTNSTSRSRSTQTRSTNAASWRTPSPPSPAARSTPTTPRGPAAATPPTSWPSPRNRTCSPPRPTRRGPTPSTPSRSTSTC